MYVEASSTCNSLNLNYGASAVGVGPVATRNVKLKVTQLGCGDTNLPPKGCTQYHFGSSGTGTIKNFNQGGGQHLADQHQSICIRREQGNCKICYYAASAADIELTGKSLATSKKGKGRFKDTLCCGNFGTDGKKTSSAGKGRFKDTLCCGNFGTDG